MTKVMRIIDKVVQRIGAAHSQSTSILKLAEVTERVVFFVRSLCYTILLY